MISGKQIPKKTTVVYSRPFNEIVDCLLQDLQYSIRWMFGVLAYHIEFQENHLFSWFVFWVRECYKARRGCQQDRLFLVDCLRGGILELQNWTLAEITHNNSSTHRESRVVLVDELVERLVKPICLGSVFQITVWKVKKYIITDLKLFFTRAKETFRSGWEIKKFLHALLNETVLHKVCLKV